MAGVSLCSTKLTTFYRSNSPESTIYSGADANIYASLLMVSERISYPRQHK